MAESSARAPWGLARGNMLRFEAFKNDQNTIVDL